MTAAAPSLFELAVAAATAAPEAEPMDAFVVGTQQAEDQAERLKKALLALGVPEVALPEIHRVVYPTVLGDPDSYEGEAVAYVGPLPITVTQGYGRDAVATIRTTAPVLGRLDWQTFSSLADLGEAAQEAERGTTRYTSPVDWRYDVEREEYVHVDRIDAHLEDAVRRSKRDETESALREDRKRRRNTQRGYAYGERATLDVRGQIAVQVLCARISGRGALYHAQIDLMECVIEARDAADALCAELDRDFVPQEA